MAKKHAIEGLEDVFLYTTQETLNNKIALFYEIECRRMNRIRFTLDFSGSDNFELEMGGYVIDTLVEPFQRVSMGRLLLMDKARGANLVNKYTWEVENPDWLEIRKIQHAEIIKINQQIEMLATNGLKACFTSNEIIQRCSDRNLLFIDMTFPPTTDAIGLKDKLLHGMRSNYLVFRRPQELSRECSLFGTPLNSTQQGLLTDCWLLSALSAIAEHPQLIYRLFSENSQQLSECGCYELRLCLGGRWCSVIIDDLIPCWPMGETPVFASSTNNIWVMLVEKCFAKVHGSYGAIKMGWAYEAMIDLTGAPYENIQFDDEATQLWVRLSQYKEQGCVMSCSTWGEDTCSAASSPRNSTPPEELLGLVPGHAYTLVEVRQLSDLSLVKLRSPWGNKSSHWKGRFGDTSDDWTDELKSEVGFCGEDRVSFWMDSSDVLKYFFCVNVSMVGIDWFELRRNLSFTHTRTTVQQGKHAARELSSSNANMYQIEVSSVPFELVVSLHQSDERMKFSEPYIDMGISILRIVSGEHIKHHHNEPTPMKAYELIESSGHSIERQVQIRCILTQPGSYVIVPYSTNAKFRQFVELNESCPTVSFWKSESQSPNPPAQGDQECLMTPKDELQEQALNRKEDDEDEDDEESTLLRQVKQSYSSSATCSRNAEEEVQVEEIDQIANSLDDFSDVVLHALKEMFWRLDLDMDGLLSKQELNEFLKQSEGIEISDSSFQWLATRFHSVTSDRVGDKDMIGLTEAGFIECYRYMCMRDPVRKDFILRSDLEFMGYDPRTVKLNYARNAALAIHVHSHSKHKIQLSEYTHCSQALRVAMDGPIKRFGKIKELEHGRVKLYSLRKSSNSGISFAVEYIGSKINKDRGDGSGLASSGDGGGEDAERSAIDFTLDVSGSENTVSHIGKLRNTVRLRVGQLKTLHHLMPRDSLKKWSWKSKYGVKYLL